MSPLQRTPIPTLCAHCGEIFDCTAIDIAAHVEGVVIKNLTTTCPYCQKPTAFSGILDRGTYVQMARKMVAEVLATDDPFRAAKEALAKVKEIRQPGTIPTDEELMRLRESVVLKNLLEEGKVDRLGWANFAVVILTLLVQVLGMWQGNRPDAATLLQAIQEESARRPPRNPFLVRGIDQMTHRQRIIHVDAPDKAAAKSEGERQGLKVTHVWADNQTR